MATPCISTDKPTPDGTYQGVWGGYEVVFKVGGKEHKAKTKDGIRGMRIPCIVTARSGSLSVRVK